MNPYLRPLYDALHDMMDFERAQALIERGHIEVAPLAFMRGRTLNDSFVILDEAQNTTTEQMKMFLTRLGLRLARRSSPATSRRSICRRARKSGLLEARDLLGEIDGIAFCQFTDVDVVRHPLVQKIIMAYDARDAARKAADAEEGRARPVGPPRARTTRATTASLPRRRTSPQIRPRADILDSPLPWRR